MMLHKCYLKKGIVYLPTVVNQGTAVYMDVEPVITVPVIDAGALRQTLSDLISKPNTFVTPSVEDARKPPVILKHSGDRNWPSFRRAATCWVIKHKGGLYKIAGHRTHQLGYWEEDPEQTIQFPPGTTADEVVDRMVAILQDAAHQ
jgi:hypothetical protein